MNLFKTSALLAFSLGSFLPLSANEYKFEEIKFDQVENRQNTYQTKDKLDEYIILITNHLYLQRQNSFSGLKDDFL